MNYSKNCENNIEENNFRSNYGASSSNASEKNHEFSAYYNRIAEFSSDASTIFVLGLISLICCMGIGIIFEIICLVKVGKYRNNELLTRNISITNPRELEMLINAKRKYKTGRTMLAIAWTVTCILLFILAVLGFMLALQ